MNKKKIVFIIRALLWLYFSLFLPIYVITKNYDLVKPNPFKYTGWAIICSIFLVISISAIFGYIIQSLKYSIYIQILSGIKKILIPIIVMLLICTIIDKNIDKIMNILKICLISEAVAIPINPFPKWVYERKIKKFKEEINL